MTCHNRRQVLTATSSGTAPLRKVKKKEPAAALSTHPPRYDTCLVVDTCRASVDTEAPTRLASATLEALLRLAPPPQRRQPVSRKYGRAACRVHASTWMAPSVIVPLIST
ncbi:hypothetical protein PIB30_015123 [Stylosanthes scabra]|uniref:Uncharacterized protein n=1 Tax=Stylosanthes scabra TaxID=79078 RepID=A0ABU6S7F9_9FABA|nr:hypothetical protein [Stylosanthes scabra]